MINNIKEYLLKGSEYKLISFITLFLVIVYNQTFYTQVLLVYPAKFDTIGFLFSIVVVLLCVTFLFFCLVLYHFNIKLILIVILLLSSMATYFMQTYHIIIDEAMIQNIIETNMSESMDLLSFKQLIYFVFLGILPSYYVYNYKLISFTQKKSIAIRGGFILISSFLIILNYFTFSKHYSSFFREHKPLRYYVNPLYWIYASGKYIAIQFDDKDTTLRVISTDAHIKEKEDEPKELVVLVVGETARADRFSLNGYHRQTNPLLEKESLINFENMSSCGTSTAVSVPCMFSIYDANEYTYNKALATENFLDLLKATSKTKILWRDNNSDSKGVALRVEYEDFKSSERNAVCDVECRDEGMLEGLGDYIQKHKDSDILIILHQMGNHGPAYYKRYPKNFEKYSPVCKSNQLETCSKEEINNAYDNAIVYTDYFLSKTIKFLKQYDKSHEVAMIYMSDHGESLGENGIYLHGLPSFMAPKEQTHVASFIWLGSLMRAEYDMRTLASRAKQSYTQDNLFHTLLGIFEVKSKVYDKCKDILHEN